MFASILLAASLGGPPEPWTPHQINPARNHGCVCGSDCRCQPGQCPGACPVAARPHLTTTEGNTIELREDGQWWMVDPVKGGKTGPPVISGPTLPPEGWACDANGCRKVQIGSAYSATYNSNCEGGACRIQQSGTQTFRFRKR